jgi:hypothetical protein
MGKRDLLVVGGARVALMEAMKHGCDDHHNVERGQLDDGVAVHGGDAAIEAAPEVAVRLDHHVGDGMEADVGEVIEGLRGMVVVKK